MVGMTTVTGTQSFSRIVPLPSDELQELPPAAPLQPAEDSGRTTGTADLSEPQTYRATRRTPLRVQTLKEPESVLPEAQPDDPEETAAETTDQAVPDGEQLGSNLDVFV
jgi:hypothetical protein